MIYQTGRKELGGEVRKTHWHETAAFLVAKSRFSLTITKKGGSWIIDGEFKYFKLEELIFTQPLKHFQERFIDTEWCVQITDDETRKKTLWWALVAMFHELFMKSDKWPFKLKGLRLIW